MNTPSYAIELLNPKKHDRNSFNCEETALNDFIKKRAKNEAKSRTSICYVLTDSSDSNAKSGLQKILGFYTLSNGSIETKSLPLTIRKNLPKYDRIPITLMGRLARDSSVRGVMIGGTTIGQILLMHALEKTYNTSDAIGSTAIVLDPKNSKVSNWYRQFGFQQLSTGQMYLSMRQIGSFINDQT